MADLYTDRLGPAARTAEPLARQSRRDPGAGRQHRPAKPAGPLPAGGQDQRSQDGPHRDGLNDDALQGDGETPPHQIDRSA